jgi:hypothetical protein
VVNKHAQISAELQSLIAEAFSKREEKFDTVSEQMIALAQVIEKYVYPEVLDFINTINDPLNYERYVSSRVVTFNKSLNAVLELLKKKLSEGRADHNAPKWISKLTEIQFSILLEHTKKRKELLEGFGEKDVGHIYIV